MVRGLLYFIVARSSLSRKKLSAQSTRSSNAKRAKRAAQVGRFSKAVQALGSLGLAPCSESTKNKLLSKHPQATLPTLLPPSTSPLPNITMGVVMKAIKSFPFDTAPGPFDTAPGPFGLRATHLKESVLCPTPSYVQSALTSITSFVSLLCSGDIPSEIVCGASLLGSLIKDGGVRPIAVGEVLCRLVSKCLSSVVVPRSWMSCPLIKWGWGSKLVLKLWSIPSTSSVHSLIFLTLLNGSFFSISKMPSIVYTELSCLKRSESGS